MVKLNAAEVRVLGVLIEKQLTTPAQYPMSVNALKMGSNQKTNRHPVVRYDDDDVLEALDGLRVQKLAGTSSGMSSRVLKYRHLLNKVFPLSLRETATLCVLLLRGPQTVGEVRARTGRMFDFSSLDEVQQTIDGLMEREAPLVKAFPVPGRKEARYAHLLAGEPKYNPAAFAEPNAPPPAGLAQRVVRLEEELAALKEAFDTFRRQFE